MADRECGHSGARLSTRVQRELDARLRRIASVARLLPALTARHGRSERLRLVRALEAGERVEPKLSAEPQRVPRSVWRDLDEARVLAPQSEATELHLARLDELELELTLMEVLGEPRRVRPMAARLYGTGDREVRYEGETLRLASAADRILATVEGQAEPAVLAASGEGSAAALMHAVAERAGLRIAVEVEPQLVANAAAGERTLFLAERRFGAREARRLAAHEILGHLIAAANGRAQPIALLSVGTADAFTDQEGLALALEERAGLMSGHRLRTLAARVWVTDRMHDGATFESTVRHLVEELGFSATESVALGERAWRGGGVARDAAYLFGWLRIREALNEGHATVDELRLGRVSLAALPTLRKMLERGTIRPGPFRPALECVHQAAPGIVGRPSQRLEGALALED